MYSSIGTYILNKCSEKEIKSKLFMVYFITYGEVQNHGNHTETNLKQRKMLFLNYMVLSLSGNFFYSKRYIFNEKVALKEQ